MKLILRYIRPYRWYILAVMLIKLLGTGTDLLMPYVLEHLLDHVIPAASDAWPVIAWGCVMLLLTLITRILNVCANRMSVRVARNSTFAVRRDLFHTALNLSGSQMDKVGLPSLISRMTSDTYNVQSFIRMIQTMGIRSPIMLCLLERHPAVQRGAEPDGRAGAPDAGEHHRHPGGQGPGQGAL